MKLIEEHSMREKEVFAFFQAVMDESHQVFLNENNGVNRIPLRIQMIIAFSTIDVLASYWFEYLGQTGKTNERAQVWYERFCRTEENEYLKGLLTEVTSERLYKFRNALVHFFGLGEDTKDIFIALAANDLSNEDREKMEAAFIKKRNKTILIRPKDFYDLVREGALLMLGLWENVIKEAQVNPQKEKEYLDGISRVYSKIMNEGAKGLARDRIGPLKSKTGSDAVQ